MPLTYNPVFNNFVTYESPEVEKPTLNLPLLGDVDISDWAESVTSSGDIKVKSNLPESYRSEKTYYVPSELPATLLSQSAASPSLKGKLKQAMDFFLSKGLSAHASAGIVGNLMVESSLNTSIKGDGGKAFGIAQWHPDRQIGLKDLAKSRGKNVSDFETQLEYVWQELNSPGYKKALDGLLTSRSVEQATIAFMKHFEKPGVLHTDKRISFAKSCLS